METEMETAIVYLWLAGVVCGTAFFSGLVGLLYLWWKKHKERLIFPFIAIVIGFSGMSYSLFALLRLVRSWVAA